MFEYEHACAKYVLGSEDSFLEWFSPTNRFWGSRPDPQTWAARVSTLRTLSLVVCIFIVIALCMSNTCYQGSENDLQK